MLSVDVEGNLSLAPVLQAPVGVGLVYSTPLVLATYGGSVGWTDRAALADGDPP